MNEKKEQYLAPILEQIFVRSLHLLETLSVEGTFEDIDMSESLGESFATLPS